MASNPRGDMMTTPVTASAPGKLMLTGSYAVVHGYPCVVTAVDQRLEVTVKKNGQNRFHLDAPDVGMTAYSKTIDDLGSSQLPKAVRFIETLYQSFLDKYPQDHGVDVQTKSDFTAQFGFGSSSAVTVAFAKALTKLYDITLSKQELFEMCYQTVLAVQGVGSGFDIAAAIWGNTIKYVKPAAEVEYVKIDDLPLVVAYTGAKADTPTLVRMVEEKRQTDADRYEQIFREISQTSDQLFQALNQADLESAGAAMTAHHRAASQLGVSTKQLDDLLEATTQAGAYGASLSGAGGGDCLVALVDEQTRSQVNAAIEAVGCQPIEVGFQAPGVRIESKK
jgi:mevalonate kinase